MPTAAAAHQSTDPIALKQVPQHVSPYSFGDMRSFTPRSLKMSSPILTIDGMVE
jgi:hypothetical protein